MALTSTQIAAIAFFFVCCVLPLCIGLIVWAVSKDDGSSPSPAPSTAPRPASSPVSTLPSGYIKLINSETTFNSTNGDVAVANQPKGLSNAALSYNLQPVQFTISFKINSTGTDNTFWREILQNSPGYSWLNNGPEQSGNSPLFFISPATFNSQPVSSVNKVTVRFLGSDGVGHEATTSTALVANQYHTITAVADTNKITIYVDGANPVTTTLPTGQTLRYRNDGGLNESNKFVWNPNPPVPGPMVPWKIKDAYWWPKVLTATEVATVHGSTTSTYMPQPLSMGTSAYVKETYMPY